MDIRVGIEGIKHGSNIMQIEVPEALQREIKTGLPFMDDCMGGTGMTPSTVMLFSGGPGAGKSTLMIQLSDAITSAGNIALFNTGEESLFQTKKVFDRLKLKNGFVVGQDHMLTEIISHAHKLHKKHDGKKQIFVIMDSLATLDDGYYEDGWTNSRTPLRCVENLCNWAKMSHQSGGIYPIVIVIAQVNKDGKISGSNKLRHAIDVHAHLEIDTRPKSETYGQRVFEVMKNRFGPAGRKYILEMSSGGFTNFQSVI